MSQQNIHIAMGSLGYAIAKADGDIQENEKNIITELAQKEFELGDDDIEWIRTMFLKLEKDHISLEDAYNYAIDTLEANRYEFDFDDGVKRKCLRFIERVAESFGGITYKESSIIDKLKIDLDRF